MRSGLAVLVVLLITGMGGVQARPLAPNQAFRFHAAIRHHKLFVRWTAAPGYHLYRDRIRLQVLPKSVRLVPFHLPAGRWVNDPAFGHQQVYEGKTRLAISFAKPPLGPTIEVVAHYQGCANAGICYPPLAKRVTLAWPAVSHAPPSPPTPHAVPSSLVLTKAVLPHPIHTASSPPWTSLFLFLAAGLGLAFTPCVFPMIPIVSATIVGQRGGRVRPLTLSLAYVTGMALTYTLAGIVAALTGHYVQAAFQNPWVIGVFSALFVVLALSMFGFYELQIPSGIQERMGRYGRGGQVAGTFVLGAFSALIVGPCVAAPLAGALLLISRTGNALFGGLALLALSLGMGLPLLVIGTSAGHLLPKAGPWLSKTRAVFGVLLLAVAIWLESRVVPPQWVLASWSLLIIVTTVAAGALEPLGPGPTGYARAAKGFAVAALAYGLILGIGALSGATSPLAPLRAFSGRAPAQWARPHLTFEPIHNIQELKTILARAHGHPVMVDFWASWCVQCQRMEANTFRDPKVVHALASFVLVRADVTKSDHASRVLLRRLHAFGPPTLVFFSSQGLRLKDEPGYEGPRTFLRHLRGLLHPKASNATPQRDAS